MSVTARIVGGLTDRAILLGSVLAAGTLPSFITQYRQRLGGMADQVSTDLAPFEAIAANHHGGSLERLVAHHRASTDATFAAEGEAIQQMIDQRVLLEDMLTRFEGGLFEQAFALAQLADRTTLQATWDTFAPAFEMSPGGIVFALIIGALVWGALQIVWHASRYFWARI